MLFGQCFRCMREEEKELSRVERENEEGPALTVSVLKFTPSPQVPDLTVSGLRELFSAPEPLSKDLVRFPVHWKEDYTLILPKPAGWPAAKLVSVNAQEGKAVLSLKTFVNPKWPIILYSSDWRRPVGDEFWKVSWESLVAHLDTLTVMIGLWRPRPCFSTS